MSLGKELEAAPIECYKNIEPAPVEKTENLDDYEKFLAQTKAKTDLDFLAKII